MPTPKILVVDDQPVNVQLLKHKLEREGLTVLTAYSGRDAVAKAFEHLPDLILLDVMMPGMDGIEACQKLRASEETRSIPVIFITARSSKEGKIEGLEVGAVDYITKPIDLDETVARVRTQLRFAEINREIIDLQRRLQEARRVATIGAVTQGIAHNMNNLLGVALGYLDLVKAHHNKPAIVMRHAENVESSLRRIVSIIRQLSSLVAQTRLPTISCPLDQLIENSLNRFRQDYPVADPIIHVQNPLGALAIDAHVEIFEDVLGKLLMNAWESYGEGYTEPRTINLQVNLVERPGERKSIELQIRDYGSGIPESVRETLFEPFISTKNTVGVGMGLTIARHSLRKCGGELTLSDAPDGGTIATIRHPVAREKGSTLIHSKK